MDPRAFLALAALLLAGCAEEPAPRGRTAEELSFQHSPAGQAAAAEAEPDEGQGRVGRPAGSTPETANPITPARWEGSTGDMLRVCPASCATLWMGGGDGSHEVGVDGRVWRIRVTITWDAVDEETRNLTVRALGVDATGPSPLVLDAPYRSEERRRVDVVVEPAPPTGPVSYVPEQGFSGLAEFNVPA